MHLETQFVMFLTIVVLVAYAASRIGVPYSIALVLTGLVVSVLNVSLEGLSPLRLEPDLILLTFLPGLLFEAGYHVDPRPLRAYLRPIVLLAIPGVLLSAVITGVLVSIEIGIPILEALLFGVIISATDPVAVVALFKELGVDKRLGVILEGESLFNDGVAIVMFSILVGIVTGTQAFSLGGALLEFFVTVAGGGVLGLAAGFMIAELMTRTDDPLINIALTTILAYGTYLLAAEILHEAVSPVIAVVVAAIIVGTYGSTGRFPARSHTTIIVFWEFIAFLINSAVFLLIGLDVEPTMLLDNLRPVLLAIVTVLITRAVVVYLFRLLINIKRPILPLKWAHIIYWGGLRGAVSIALALSLPVVLESRGLIRTMVFGYVLFSLIVQGLSVPILLRRLGMSRRTEEQEQFETTLAEVAQAQASLAAIDQMEQEHTLATGAASRLRSIYQQEALIHQGQLDHLVLQNTNLGETSIQIARREISTARRQALQRLLRRGMISEEVYAEATEKIDEFLHRGSVEAWSPVPDENVSGEG